MHGIFFNHVTDRIFIYFHNHVDFNFRHYHFHFKVKAKTKWEKMEENKIDQFVSK